MSVIKILVVAFLLSYLNPPKAQAYLDPGTGSYLFQTLAAVFLGGLVSFKFFWKNIKSFLIRLFKTPKVKK